MGPSHTESQWPEEKMDPENAYIFFLTGVTHRRTLIRVSGCGH